MVCTRGWGNKIKDKIQKDQNQFQLLMKSWRQTRVLEAKQDTAHTPCTQHHQRGGQTTEVTPLARPLDTPLPSPI